jgi:hypothetical protein
LLGCAEEGLDGVAAGGTDSTGVGGRAVGRTPDVADVLETGGGSAGSSFTGGAGGSSSPATGGVAGSETHPPSAGAGSGGTNVTEEDPSAELYDPERVPRFDLELPASSIAALDETPDEYVRGALRYEGELVADIGVRIKGEASQRSLAEKAAFKLKLDKFVPKQSFRGLRRLTFNNMVEDPSFVAERLAYHFYRSVGLPAPRCNHAEVYVNGVLYGLYANLEAEDKAFLKRWFESDEGNLYEEDGVDLLPGRERDFELETNEAVADRSDLVALIEAIASSTPETYVDDVGAQLDMDHYFAFTAAEAAVNQWDMYSYTVLETNNFRLYRDPSQQRFVMLPWGMDISLKPFTIGGASIRHIDLLVPARRYDRPTVVTAGVVFRRCLESQPCVQAYLAVARDMADRFEAAELGDLAARYYDQVKDYIAADPRKEYTLPEVEHGYASLLQTIRERPDAMRSWLDHEWRDDDEQVEDAN